MQLDPRKLRILQAIIDDYIVSAEPVGSRTIARKSSIGLSSATIRNEMSDLEEMGYLEQPHTSAGRIPSDKAYRLYVDRLMKVRPLHNQEAEHFKRLYDQKTRQIEQVILYTARILSDITTYTSMVMAPQLNKVTIRHIQLVPVDSQVALLVIVTSSGIMRDTLITIPEGIDGDYLVRISNMLNEHFRDKTFDQVDVQSLQQIQQEFSKDRKFFHTLIDILTESFAAQDSKEIYLGGTTNIFNFPEYQDILRAKAFLGLMEEKDLLYKMLSASEGEGVSVTIGSENPYDEIKDCSIVTATYRIGDRVLGTIGIIGPTRMEYAKTVSVMDHMGKTLSQYLTRIYYK